MPTFGDTIDEVISKLSGFAATGDRVTWLTGDVAGDDLALSVADASGFARGLVEIDQEMLYISSYDTTGNQLTVPPFGRGYRGTTANSHTSGTMVSMAPSWPRSSVAREINNQINLLFPSLFAIGTTTLTTDGITYQFDGSLPIERILDVRWLFNTVDGWQRASQFEVDNTLTSGGSTRINVYDPLPPGTTVQVVYAKRPSPLVNESDDFITTGLPATCKDLIIFGVVAQMAQFIDVARLPVLTAETDSQAGGKQLGSGMQIANQFRQQYAQRLLLEQQALHGQYPVRSHKVR